MDFPPTFGAENVEAECHISTLPCLHDETLRGSDLRTEALLPPLLFPSSHADILLRSRSFRNSETFPESVHSDWRPEGGAPVSIPRWQFHPATIYNFARLEGVFCFAFGAAINS